MNIKLLATALMCGAFYAAEGGNSGGETDEVEGITLNLDGEDVSRLREIMTDTGWTHDDVLRIVVAQMQNEGQTAKEALSTGLQYIRDDIRDNFNGDIAAYHASADPRPPYLVEHDGGGIEALLAALGINDAAGDFEDEDDEDPEQPTA